ncbi:bacteriohemerythrin [Pararhodospirillum photometricum]|uniref:Methyl-accepting chemotaxis protein n=1 Tax=Pararhodospirillum photometricum DSM 122 TaxID=1150469 RepID=H6SIY9_PARPM|nr:bacteriohemerythrin [Pararhodospirillum photometricum]CCG07954.1 Methyl-accepting chemotaxis protein [Pararhodospirillum photometricum DSM 122]
MNRFSIGLRIGAGFLITLLLLACISLVGLQGISEARYAFSDYARIAGNTLVLKGIDRDVANLRRTILTFVSSGDPKVLDQIKDLQDALARDLTTVHAAVHDSVVREGVGRMKGLFDAYAQDVAEVVRLRQERDRQTANSDGFGPKLSGLANGLQAAALEEGEWGALARSVAITALITDARLYVVRFQGRIEPASAQKALSLLADLQTKIREILPQEEDPRRRETLSQLLETAAAYAKAFDTQAQATLAYQTLTTDAMPKKAAAFGDVAREVSQRQTDTLESLMQTTTLDLDDTWTLDIALSVLALVFGIGAAAVIARGITGPVTAMTDAMRRLAEGDKTILIPGQGARDEIGAMAKAVQVFKDNARHVEKLQQEQEENKRRAEIERKAAVRQMADAFEASVGQVVQTVTSAATQLQASSAQMAATARQTSAQAVTVATAAEQASNNVGTVASAAEELASSEAEIGQHIQRSAVVADQAAQQAQTTHATVTQMVEAVGKIGEIVTLINDIASQTNLLALNATIEAARAGDAGKGFAVVANEVKTLATQTARATGEIESQISRVQAVTHEAARAIETVITTITEIDRISGSIAVAIEEQTAATSEIARNVDQASQGTLAVTENIQSVRQAAGETGHAAEDIANAAADLSRQAEMLREEVKKFLDQVRLDDTERTLFTWDRSLETGVAEIDRHHRDMVEMTNGFYQDMLSGKGTVRFPEVFDTVNRTFDQHFQDEERLMQRYTYADYTQHREVHRETLETIVAFKARYARGEDIGLEFFRYLTQWLQEHLSTHDARLAHFLRQKGTA